MSLVFDAWSIQNMTQMMTRIQSVSVPVADRRCSPSPTDDNLLVFIEEAPRSFGAVVSEPTS
jgi:hypothetical protein